MREEKEEKCFWFLSVVSSVLWLLIILTFYRHKGASASKRTGYVRLYIVL